MEFDTQFAKQNYSKKECVVLNTMVEPKKIRLMVLSDEVKQYKNIIPREYCNLPSRPDFEDHRVFLRVGSKCIGFMVSPYNLHYERLNALAREGHTVFEIRQQYHPNAQTIAVLKNEYSNVVFWKIFELK